jgi:hypothetical protein
VLYLQDRPKTLETDSKAAQKGLMLSPDVHSVESCFCLWLFFLKFFFITQCIYAPHLQTLEETIICLQALIGEHIFLLDIHRATAAFVETIFNPL